MYVALLFFDFLYGGNIIAFYNNGNVGMFKMGNGEFKMENGKWKIENLKWKVENGKFKMENGKL